MTTSASMQLCGYGDESTMKAMAKAAALLHEESDEPLSDVTARDLDLLWGECMKQGRF